MTLSELRPAERVYQSLRDAVIAQNFTLGEKLMINVLADKFYVSSTPIREALSRLRGERLIEFQYGQGYYCKIPSLEELNSLYGLLEILLVSSAETFCPNQSPSLAAPSFSASEAAGTLSEGADAEIQDKILETEELLESIVRMTGNQMVSHVAKNIHARTRFILGVAFKNATTGAQLDEIIDRLRDAISDEDMHSAKSIVVDYISIVRNKLPDLLRDVIAAPYMNTPDTHLSAAQRVPG